MDKRIQVNVEDFTEMKTPSNAEEHIRYRKLISIPCICGNCSFKDIATKFILRKVITNKERGFNENYKDFSYWSLSCPKCDSSLLFVQDEFADDYVANKMVDKL